MCIEFSLAFRSLRASCIYITLYSVNEQDAEVIESKGFECIQAKKLELWSLCKSVLSTFEILRAFVHRETATVDAMNATYRLEIAACFAHSKLH